MNTNDEEIKGFFTAYLDVALKREREDYINGKSKEEIPIDIETVDAEKQVEFEQNYEAMILEKLKEFSGTRVCLKIKKCTTRLFISPLSW